MPPDHPSPAPIMGSALVVRLDTLPPTNQWCSCGCVVGRGMLVGLWLPGTARVRYAIELQSSVNPGFLVFFLNSFAFCVW